MIRINLLGIKRDVKGSRMPSVSMEGARSTAVFVIVFVLAIGALFAHYTMLNGEADRLAEELRQVEAEKQRLSRVKAEVDEFEKKKTYYTNRINIIDKLKEYRSGPVTLLNALANTVESSGTLWLTSFDNNGQRINLSGVAANVNTVADFITNLKNSGHFRNVEIRDSYQDDRYKDMMTFVFRISAELAPATPPAQEKKT